MLKKTLKVLCVLIAAVLVCAVVLIAWLSVTEYKPKAVEKAEIYDSEATGLLDKNESIKILSFNTGYAGLGEEADFFMDGGKNIRTGDKDTVLKNLAGISGIIENSDADICLLQEVDSDSMRTFGIDEREYYLSGSEKYAAFALNYSCAFVPYPLPPIGKVNSGLMTVSDYKIADSERISLPCPFSWPVRVANLKRCLLASYCDIEGTDAKLVIVNLHLEAYDDGEGKAAQTKMLKEFLQAEYEKECNEAEMELYIKPRNLLAVKRAEAIERYKVYENRVKLYVDANREAIEKRLIEARNREIDENLLALAEYVEG